jgi:hypothetical protein
MVEVWGPGAKFVLPTPAQYALARFLCFSPRKKFLCLEKGIRIIELTRSLSAVKE